MKVGSTRIIRSHADTLLLVFLVALFYLPVVTQNYLFADDHGVFSESLADQLDPIKNNYLRDGRPLTGLVLVTLVDACDSFEGFKLIRAIGLISTAWLAVILNRLLKAAEVGRISALAAALGIVTVPGFAIYVGWASCFLYPLSAILALFAGTLLSRMVEERVGVGRCLVAGAISVMALILSLSIYQITATFFAIPLLLTMWLCTTRDQGSLYETFRPVVARLFAFVSVAGISFLLYALCTALLKGLFQSQHTLGQRSFFSFQGLEWFAHAKAILFMVMPSWMHFLGQFSQLVFLILLLGIIVSACIYNWLQFQAHHRGKGITLLRTGLQLGIVCAPMLVLVFVDHPTTPWRLYSGVSAVFLFWLSIAVSKRTEQGRHMGCRQVVSGLLAMFLIGSTAYGGYIFRAGFVNPNARETEMANALMREQISQDSVLFVLGVPVWFDYIPSGSFEYAFKGSGFSVMFPRHAFRSFFGNYFGRAAVGPSRKFIVLNVQPPPGVSNRTCVASLEAVGGFHASLEPVHLETKAIHKTFGPVIELLDYVLYSKRYGYFIETAEDWFFNPILGNLRVVYENNEVFYVYSDLHGKLMLLQDANTDWIWSENLDKWIQLRDLHVSSTFLPK